MGGLRFYRPGDGLDLILDRCWRSEIVYGARFRGIVPNHHTMQMLDEWAVKLGAVYIQMDAENELLVDRLTRRGDDLVSPDQIADVAEAYRRLFIAYPWPGVQATPGASVDSVIRLAEQEERLRQTQEES